MLDPESRYAIYRADRKHRSGGGSCVFIDRSLKSNNIENPNILQNAYVESGCEIVCFDVYFTGSKIRYILIYRPPCYVIKTEIDSKLSGLSKIVNFLSSTKDPVIVLGDLNLPDIDWDLFSLNNSNHTNCFTECMQSLGMTQFVSDSTRISNTHASNILDLIFANDPLLIQITNQLPPLSTSDHNIIEFVVLIPSSTHNVSAPIASSEYVNTSIELPKYNWSAADFVSITNYLLDVDWHSLFGHYFDTESIWSQFKSIIWPIIDMFVPKTATPHFNKYNPRQYPKNIRILLNRKAALWRILRTCKTSDHLKSKYTEIALKTKRAIIDFDLNREEKIIKANNLGAFYRYVNNKLNNNNGIAPLFDKNGNLITADIDKANLLNDYFKSVFITDDGLLPDFPSRLPPGSSEIHDINISPEIITKILRDLKSNSAAGPDNIPSIFYKKTSVAISYPLSIMFRTFIDLHDIPTDWKTAIITPKFKKGQPSLASNYRPIALTCACCKVLEKIIANDLINYLQDRNLISKQQHGFLKHHSTATNLLDSLNDWSVSLSKRHCTTTAYIDFQRAFDSVSHHKLIHKLKSYGVSGNLILWISAFLSNRSQTVRIGSSLSDACAVSSGIPQGSVLGPTLFIIFINDISDSFNPSVQSKLFADDIKIYSVICDISTTSSFQTHLDLINAWSNAWQLPIAHSKCSIFQIGSRYCPCPDFTFTLAHCSLTRSSTILDLGITLDENLKFTNHIQSIVQRAFQRANLVHRAFLSNHHDSLVQAFKVYVRPLLEYNSIIWSPSQVGLINSVEHVQRSFTKRLHGLQTLPYTTRLTVLKLQSLEHRRLINDLTLCYNIVYKCTSLAFDDYFLFSHNPSSRGHHLRLSLPLVKTNLEKSFFSWRVIKPWNALPSHIVSAATSKIFKSRLSNFDLSKFLLFPSV